MYPDTHPVFNLKVVLKETGLAADTLRAWERRYGLPAPQRTPGGHRLYSERDIHILKWLIARQKEGLSISRAVDLWNEQTAQGLDPLSASDQAAESSLSWHPAISGLLKADLSLETIRAQWLSACMSFNESVAEQVVNQAFSVYPVETVCLEVFQKGLAEMGNLWYEDRASVQQEHFASALAMRRLDALLTASPSPIRQQSVIIGCPADEWHAFMPLLLTLLLRRRGLPVIYLGANVPNDKFAETADSLHAHLVVLVAQTLVTAANLQEVAQRLSSQGIRVAYGGRIFNLHPSIRDVIPAHFLGQEISDSIETVERLLEENTPAGQLQTQPIPQECMVAHQFFLSRRPEIEATLRQLVQPLTISPGNLTSGIAHLGNIISASLRLGAMTYASGEIEWLKTLMKTHGQPSQELIGFLKSYAHAVEQHLNGAGHPIFEWLLSEIDKLQS